MKVELTFALMMTR